VGTAEDLLEIHRRTHTSLRALLEHCAGFSDADQRRSLEGFGYPTLLLQLHHVIAAERYWVGVLRGEMLSDDLEADYASLDAVRAFEARVADATVAWLRGASEAEIRTRREMTTWGDRRQQLVPALVILRTQTHAYQHQGQVTAMCRLLGRPVGPGLDFPLGE
jgi:uncharacterized damage-inducible protein DinB